MTKIERKNIQILILLLLSISVILSITFIYTIITKKHCDYEYVNNGKVGHSKNCYLKNGDAYCIIDEKETKVNNFYISY